MYIISCAFSNVIPIINTWLILKIVTVASLVSNVTLFLLWCFYCHLETVAILNWLYFKWFSGPRRLMKLQDVDLWSVYIFLYQSLRLAVPSYGTYSNNNPTN